MSLKSQKLIDAVNKDDLREKMEDGEPLTPRQQAIWQEFEEKAKLLAGPKPAGDVRRRCEQSDDKSESNSKRD